MHFILQKKIKLYRRPLSNAGVTGSHPGKQLENLGVTYSRPSISAVSYPWFCILRFNHGPYSTVVFTTEKNPCINGPTQFKPVLFKGVSAVINLILNVWNMPLSKWCRGILFKRKDLTVLHTLTDTHNVISIFVNKLNIKSSYSTDFKELSS